MAGKKDLDRAEILETFARLFGKPDPISGRDTVAGPVRVIHGGDGSRRLNIEVVRSDSAENEMRLVLKSGGGEISARLRRTGIFLVAFGEATFEATTRAAGGAFVDALSRWLGTPLGAVAPLPSLSEPLRALQGNYAELGGFIDGDGVQWRRFKISVGGEDNDGGDFGDSGDVSEFFLGLCNDNRRAWLSEKWSRYRVPLLRAFDNALGARREILDRKLIAVVGGGAWFSMPTDWIVSPGRKHTLVADPLDSCSFEVSCLPLPRLAPGLPSLRRRLEDVLEKIGQAQSIANIVAVDRGDIDAVWVEHPYLCDDKPGEPQREARARVLFAANDHLCALTTFTFWPEHIDWAVLQWHRIIESLTLREPNGTSSPETPA